MGLLKLHEDQDFTQKGIEASEDPEETTNAKNTPASEHVFEIGRVKVDSHERKPTIEIKLLCPLLIVLRILIFDCLSFNAVCGYHRRGSLCAELLPRCLTRPVQLVVSHLQWF